MTLSIRILIGLAVGIAFGLFVGEYADNLSWIGEVFIGLVQMTVLAYIVVSLVANIGHLSTEQARRVLRIGGALLAIFLAIGTIALGIIPLSFPKLGTAAFFSRSLIEPRKSIDVLDLYVQINPFNSVSTGTVPANFSRRRRSNHRTSTDKIGTGLSGPTRGVPEPHQNPSDWKATTCQQTFDPMFVRFCAQESLMQYPKHTPAKNHSHPRPNSFRPRRSFTCRFRIRS